MNIIFFTKLSRERLGLALLVCKQKSLQSNLYALIYIYNTKKFEKFIV